MVDVGDGFLSDRLESGADRLQLTQQSGGNRDQSRVEHAGEQQVNDQARHLGAIEPSKVSVVHGFAEQMQVVHGLSVIARGTVLPGHRDGRVVERQRARHVHGQRKRHDHPVRAQRPDGTVSPRPRQTPSAVLQPGRVVAETDGRQTFPQDVRVAHDEPRLVTHVTVTQRHD